MYDVVIGKPDKRCKGDFRIIAVLQTNLDRETAIFYAEDVKLNCERGYDVIPLRTKTRKEIMSL